MNKIVNLLISFVLFSSSLSYDPYITEFIDCTKNLDTMYTNTHNDFYFENNLKPEVSVITEMVENKKLDFHIWNQLLRQS